ncbi:hypothetical protein ACI2JA_03415 [Alkalihalobacillus sp. NPDC078783]
MEKKRYILFGYMGYYPSGGMKDAMISFEDKEELIRESSGFGADGYNILDTETFNVGKGYSPTVAFDDIGNVIL